MLRDTGLLSTQAMEKGLTLEQRRKRITGNAMTAMRFLGIQGPVGNTSGQITSRTLFTTAQFLAVTMAMTKKIPLCHTSSETTRNLKAESGLTSVTNRTGYGVENA